MDCQTSGVVVVRASSLSQYCDCPRRQAAKMFPVLIRAAGFELRQLDRGIAASIGTAVHRSAAVILDEKARTGNLPPADVATDAAIEMLHADMAEGVGYDDPVRGITRTAAEAELQTRRMAAAYRTEIAPTVDPLIVEQRLEAQVTPLIVLSGQADLVAREPGRVLDLKTGGKLGSHNPQVGAYALLARTPRDGHPDGIEINEAGIDFIQRVPARKPQPPAVRVRLDVATVENAAIHVLRHIEDDLRVFMEGDPQRKILPGDPWSFPSNPNSVLCSRKWCSAHSTPFCVEHYQPSED